MNIKSLLSDDEFKQITTRNNYLAARCVAFDWGVISLCFILCGMFPNPLTILLSIIVIGSRQLGLGIIVHETGHRTLFTDSKTNDFVGNWLAGYWVFSDKDAYIREHLEHHRKAGSIEDPDLKNYQNYPINRRSLGRKIKRDLTGQIGWRRVKSIFKAFSKYSKLNDGQKKYLSRSALCNLILLGVLALFGTAWLYLVWVIAFMTSHMLVTRIRQIAEHAGVPDLLTADPRLNTRTLYINRLEGFLIAPHQVNYHLEHHLLASVPIYNLKLMHQILLDKGYYKDVEFTRGYVSLLRNVTTA